MAKANPRAGRGAPARATAKSKKSAEVEVAAEDAPGMGIDAGLAILTSIVLVAAVILVDALMGKIDKGIFFT